LAVAPPKPEMSAAPKEVAATKETKEPTPIIPKVVDPAKEPEIKVAAVAPEEASKPVGPTNPVPAIEPETPEGLQQIFFDKGETKLPANGTSELKKLASVVSSSNQRIQLVAYADASSNGTARRLSLGRALVIRSELMALGVPNNKIEVRALGKPTDSSPADRVDLKLVAR
ncbi:MAG: OmpA family protein, partial [Sneathiella sp.]